MVQSQVKFNRVPEKLREKVWDALMQNQVRFKRVPKKVPEKVWDALHQARSGGRNKVHGEGSGQAL